MNLVQLQFLPGFIGSNFSSGNILGTQMSCLNAVCDMDVQDVSLGIAFPLLRPVGVLNVTSAGVGFCSHHFHRLAASSICALTY